jgi:hypothetical protein
MSVVTRFVVLAVAGGLTLSMGAHAALAADPATGARPTTGGEYAYSGPEAAPYVGARAVVHYVSTGPAAPPLNDDDHTGYPDYVEQVGSAADTALLYYERHGFKLPLADAAGPDSKPDIYVDNLPPGVFGLTFPETAEGGTFVIVSPRLDSRQKTFGSLQITVAHELFHVIQFSYVKSGRLPVWAAEGSASAFSMLVFPHVDDLAMQNYLDSWLTQPWLPLYDERSGCVHCYGGAWWWQYLARLNPGILPRYFALLGAADQQGKPARVGVAQLDRALRNSRAGALNEVFAAFSLNLYRRGLPVGGAYSLRSTTKPRATSVRPLYGLSTQYVPVRVPPSSRGVVVAPRGRSASAGRARRRRAERSARRRQAIPPGPRSHPLDVVPQCARAEADPSDRDERSSERRSLPGRLRRRGPARKAPSLDRVLGAQYALSYVRRVGGLVAAPRR